MHAADHNIKIRKRLAHTFIDYFSYFSRQSLVQESGYVARAVSSRRSYRAGELTHDLHIVWHFGKTFAVCLKNKLCFHKYEQEDFFNHLTTASQANFLKG